MPRKGGFGCFGSRSDHPEIRYGISDGSGVQVLREFSLPMPEESELNIKFAELVVSQQWTQNDLDSKINSYLVDPLGIWSVNLFQPSEHRGGVPKGNTTNFEGFLFINQITSTSCFEIPSLILEYSHLQLVVVPSVLQKTFCCLSYEFSLIIKFAILGIDWNHARMSDLFIVHRLSSIYSTTLRKSLLE